MDPYKISFLCAMGMCTNTAPRLSLPNSYIMDFIVKGGIIGTSLSKPHTSVTSLCLLACLADHLPQILNQRKFMCTCTLSNMLNLLRVLQRRCIYHPSMNLLIPRDRLRLEREERATARLQHRRDRPTFNHGGGSDRFR